MEYWRVDIIDDFNFFNISITMPASHWDDNKEDDCEKIAYYLKGYIKGKWGTYCNNTRTFWKDLDISVPRIEFRLYREVDAILEMTHSELIYLTTRYITDFV